MYVSQITQISQIYANYVNSFSFIYPVSCPHITSIRIKKHKKLTMKQKNQPTMIQLSGKIPIFAPKKL